jgi:hypothetical protein
LATLKSPRSQPGLPRKGGKAGARFSRCEAGTRRPIAFAFKGPGTTGVLTQRKLGKNGDQIQRLFLNPAEIFIVQYHGEIGQAVTEQMKAFASLNSVREGKVIWYGLIDGDDSNRLMAAYPKHFRFK